MEFSASDFLTLVKFTVTGGGIDAQGRAKLDAGFLKDEVLLMDGSLLLSGTTYVADSAGFPVLSTAATNTTGPVISWTVPRDYDEKTDQVTLRFVANMGGASDTPTVTITPKTKVVGSAATTLATQTTAALSATETLYTVTFNSPGLKRGNILLLTFTTGAHTTDVIQYRSIYASYRSCLVSYHQVDSSGNDLR